MKTVVTRTAVLTIATVASAVAQSTVHAALQPSSERKPAADFNLADASGRIIPLSKYRGKVVLLNFWATECGGCKVEIPWFMEFDRRYKSDGLQTVGVSMDIVFEGLKGPAEGWARVNPFVSERRLKYPILMADDQVVRTYKVDAMPATYLIDQKGRIAATYVGLVNKLDVETNLKTLLREH